MKRRHKIKWSTLLIFCLLFVSLQTLGVTYARWVGTLQIGGAMTAGTLDIQAPQKGFRAFLVDSEGAPVAGRAAEAGVSAQPSENGETLLLTIDGGFAAAALAEDGFLKLEVPIQQGAASTVTGVEQVEVDLTAAAGEELELTPSDPELVVSGTVLAVDDLPPNLLNGFAVPMTAEIYRQVKEGADGPVAAIYLRLTEESRKALRSLQDRTLSLDALELPAELLKAAGAEETEADSLSVSAEVRVTYACALTLYVEQGNEDVLLLPEEEGRR